MSAIHAFWPAQASRHAHDVDLLIASFGTMIWLLTLPVFILMAVFAIRYRRGRKVNRQHAPNGNVWIEVSWSAIPFVLTIGFYIWATALFLDLRQVPADATPVHVVAKQWMWKFEHSEGAREINNLHVPVGTPIRLIMTSQDVVHSLFVPALRIKQDVLPGRYTEMWFTAEQTGEFPIRCAEFCGTDHSVMGGRLTVMRREDYAAWLAASSDGGQAGTMAMAGRRLFRTAGCSGCHGAASAVHAPALEGLFGRPVGLADGETTVADEQYLRDSIMLPNKHVAAGYRPIMPTYADVLKPQEVNELVSYLRSIGPEQEERR